MEQTLKQNLNYTINIPGGRDLPIKTHITSLNHVKPLTSTWLKLFSLQGKNGIMWNTSGTFIVLRYTLQLRIMRLEKDLRLIKQECVSVVHDITEF